MIAAVPTEKRSKFPLKTDIYTSILLYILVLFEPRREKTSFLCENKGADQLRGDREADQRLCFRYTDITIPVLPKSEISSL